MNIFKWENIDLKGRRSGILKTVCPECSHTRTKKTDPCLYVNIGTGIAKCFNCDSLSFAEDRKQNPEKKPFKQLSQDLTIQYSQNLLSWLGGRSISEKTARSLYVTEEKHYQPFHKSVVNNIVFNYYKEAKLVNKKYRSGAKKFTQEAGAEVIMYNINACIGNDTVYVVEGEMDVLAMVEAGYRNTISVPNGANDNDDYWINSEPFLKDIKWFIIGSDGDEKGLKLREAMAQRLGRYRCKYIEWNGKDANDDLISGHIHESIKNQKSFKVSGVLTTEDLRDDLFKLYDEGLPKTITPTQERWDEVSKIFSLMMGQLVTVTGIPSHGKSSVIDDYVISLCHDLDLKASWFSPEHNPKAIHQMTFAKKVIGREFWGENRMSRQELNDYISYGREKIYITAQEQETPTWEWLFEKMESQIYQYGVNIFVIDAFNKVILGNPTKAGIDQVITRLTSFCIRHNVIIFLIAHPTKMQKNDDGTYKIPDLYDISGTADFRNQTHCGVTIYREFEETNEFGHIIKEGKTIWITTKVKFDFQGKINATCDLSYSKRNSRFFTGQEPLYSYINAHNEERMVYKIDYNTGDVEGKIVDIFRSANINGVSEFEHKEEPTDNGECPF